MWSKVRRYQGCAGPEVAKGVRKMIGEMICDAKPFWRCFEAMCLTNRVYSREYGLVPFHEIVKERSPNVNRNKIHKRLTGK
jgi:hypothetical protein